MWAIRGEPIGKVVARLNIALASLLRGPRARFGMPSIPARKNPSSAGRCPARFRGLTPSPARPCHRSVPALAGSYRPIVAGDQAETIEVLVNVIICDDETCLCLCLCLDAVCSSPRTLDGALVTSFDASGSEVDTCTVRSDISPR